MASFIRPYTGFVLFETRATRLTLEFSRRRSVRLPASPGLEKQAPKVGIFRIPVDWAPTPVHFNFQLQPSQAQAA